MKFKQIIISSLLSLTLLFSINVYSQTKYTIGFNTGFANGYCYNKEFYCLAPTPPISPIPKIGESSESYQDGYNRGFETGLESNTSSQTERKRYQTSSANPIDFIQKQNINDVYALSQILLDAKAKSFELQKIGDYQASINIAQAGLKVIPNDEEFLGLIATGELQLRNYNIALIYLKKIAKITNEKLIKEVIEEIENGTYQKRNIENDKKEFAQISKKQWEEFNQKLKLYYETKNYKSIIELLSPQVEQIKAEQKKDPKFVNFIFTYTTLAYYNSKDWKNLISDANIAIQQVERNELGNYYFLRGLAKSNLGDYYGSNSDYEFLITNINNLNYKTNSLATLYNNKAYNLILLEDFEGAKPLINKAIELDNSVDYIWQTKGELEFKTGKYKESIKSMDNSIQIKPSGNAYLYRGLSNIKSSNKTQGCKDLSKSGELGEDVAYDYIKIHCK